MRDTPRKAIIKLSCGCVFHYDCVLEYIRKVEDRIDIAKTNTKQWDITNEVIPSTELDRTSSYSGSRETIQHDISSKI